MHSPGHVVCLTGTWRQLCAAFFVLATSLLSIPGGASAATIVNLSTGVSSGGTLIAFGNPDDQWTVAEPGSTSFVSATVVEPSRSFFTNLEPNARWISVTTVTSQDDAAWGNYTYKTQFPLSLATLSDLSIQGHYAADNRLIEIRLNGHVVFVGPNVSGSACTPTGCDEFSSPTAFSITDPSYFVNGVNVLEVVIENQGPTFSNPTSFLLSGAVQGTSVSEPSSILSIDFSGTATEVSGAPGDDTPLQSGYVGWAGPYEGNPGLNYNETRTFATAFGIGGVVNVTVKSDGLFFRDYEPIAAGPFLAQSALLSDSILRNQPGSIFLSFTSLKDGVYGMTSFHHDTRFGSTFVPFNIILTDGLVTDQTLFAGLDTTGGTAPSSITKAEYTFTVVAGSTVTIEFSGQAQPGQHMSVNGFQLQRIGDAQNTSPVCTAAQAVPSVIWTPNHQFVPIAVMGVTDPDGDSVTITVTGVTQDEPVKGAGTGNTSPDAVIEAGAASVRAERSGTGNGRVYQVSFKAQDGKGSSCTGAVMVGVPHSLQRGLTAIDDGQVYDSTVP